MEIIFCCCRKSERSFAWMTKAITNVKFNRIETRFNRAKFRNDQIVLLSLAKEKLNAFHSRSFCRLTSIKVLCSQLVSVAVYNFLLPLSVFFTRFFDFQESLRYVHSFRFSVIVVCIDSSILLCAITSMHECENIEKSMSIKMCRERVEWIYDWGWSKREKKCTEACS